MVMQTHYHVNSGAGLFPAAQQDEAQPKVN
jgi:hypothetical protein